MLCVCVCVCIDCFCSIAACLYGGQTHSMAQCPAFGQYTEEEVESSIDSKA